MSFALESKGLTRRFGDLIAVDSVDLAVPAGSFYGFLGPNGAGKSTTIKCLTGLLRPSGGQIRILELDPLEDPVAVKKLTGVVPEDLALFDRLTATETLSFVGQIHGLAKQTLEQRVEELLQVMALADRRDHLVTDFSHGMKKKLALAVALLPAPRLLFLDEPFEGIDAVASQQIRGLLKAYVGRGGTIFLTSHILQIVETLCDQIGVINRGRLIAQGSMAQMRHGTEDGRTLEQIFLDLVGAESATSAALEWLT
jgi:ABC-2 type transport system ATP-binding protein